MTYEKSWCRFREFDLLENVCGSMRFLNARPGKTKRRTKAGPKMNGNGGAEIEDGDPKQCRARSNKALLWKRRKANKN
jgi:hypothetical protein